MNCDSGTLKAVSPFGGCSIPAAFNTLGLKEKLPTMSEDEQFALLATDGMLVKRPILVGDDFVFFGFKEADWSSQFS